MDLSLTDLLEWELFGDARLEWLDAAPEVSAKDEAGSSLDALTL